MTNYLKHFQAEPKAAKRIEEKLKALEQWRAYLNLDVADLATGIKMALQKVYDWGDLLTDVEAVVEELEIELEAYEAKLYVETKKRLQSERLSQSRTSKYKVPEIKETDIKMAVRMDEDAFAMRLVIAKWRKFANKVRRCGVKPSENLTFTYNNLVKLLVTGEQAYARVK